MLVVLTLLQPAYIPSISLHLQFNAFQRDQEATVMRALEIANVMDSVSWKNALHACDYSTSTSFLLTVSPQVQLAPGSAWANFNAPRCQ